MAIESPEPAKFKFSTLALVGLMIMLLPLSVKLFFPVISTVVIFPSELLIGILGLLFLYNLYITRDFSLLDKKFLKHPITIIIFLYLLINLLSTLFSTMHLVSLKAFIVKSCYIIVFYFYLYTIIKLQIKSFIEMIKLYGFALALVIIYSLLNQNQLGFNRTGAGFACHPFYNDHTIFSASIAFVLPVFLALSFFTKTLDVPNKQKLPIYLTSIILLIGFYFSFSRAGWVSATVSSALFILILSGLRFKGIIFLFLSIILILAVFHKPVFNFLKQNKTDSTVTNAGLYEHIFSLTNISSDVSNKERLNRWDCSLSMGKEKPWLGFGLGTYQFKYLDYQETEKMTYISRQKPLKPGFGTFYWYSNAMGLVQEKDYTYFQGGGGTAHSEYFLELAEGGVISFLLFVALLFAALYIGIKSYINSKNKSIKILVLVILLSLITYFTHGLFNNFLDDCKLAFLFWTSLAALTAIDLFNSEKTAD
jgi:putative inorganic carbon (HCO3(-)) transporter